MLAAHSRRYPPRAAPLLKQATPHSCEIFVVGFLTAYPPTRCASWGWDSARFVTDSMDPSDQSLPDTKVRATHRRDSHDSIGTVGPGTLLSFDHLSLGQYF